jgi:hypothetical protein
VLRRYTTYMLFGGAGLVGMATARRIARFHEPERIVVASLKLAEAEGAVAELAAEFPDVEWVPAAGNLFVPTDMAQMGRGEILGNAEHRERMMEFTFGPFDAAYAVNHMARMIVEHKPDAIVDCVNTATGISYQNVFEMTAILRQGMAADELANMGGDVQAGLMGQAMPQLIRHVRLLYKATVEAGTSVYVKVGTTGTGGMGFNIPYTHSEDRPSKVLLAKNAVAFAHTGLLFLLARTPDAPVVKEVKPAAMIGYRGVEVRTIPDRQGGVKALYRPRRVALDELTELQTRQAEAEYEATGESLTTTVVNTGENGLFAMGEFGAITALQQMEFVTPEEIAHRITQEIAGGNTGNDIIGALDASIITPSYRAGQLRYVAMKDLQRLQQADGRPSVALGELGPPELSKLLFEVSLIKDVCGDRLLGSLMDADGEEILPEDLASRMAQHIDSSEVAQQAISIGIPILLPDGDGFLRGPLIKVPEIKGKTKIAALGDGPERAARLDRWASRGWIDLRPPNMKLWQDRFRKMDAARQELARLGSAGVSRATYLPVGLKIGDVVAWIFNNEMGGFRDK